MKNIVFILVVLSMWACGRGSVYEQNFDLQGRYWHKDSIQAFSFEIGDANKDYSFYANIRNSYDYPFHNLYVNYAITDSTDKILKQQLVNIPLYDAKSGDPLGSGLGDTYDVQYLLLSGYRLPRRGAYKMYMQHYMRKDSLPSVLSVGLRVEETQVPGQ